MTAPVSSLRHERRNAMARAVATAAFAFVVGGSPIAASAQEPQLAPNPNYGSITINEDVINSQVFLNYGSVQLNLDIVNDVRQCCVLGNQGTLSNLIDSTTGAVGKFDIYGYLYNASAGVIDNAGSFIFRPDAYLLNHGNFNNSTGSLLNNGNIWNYKDSKFTNSGALDHTGYLRNDSDFLSPSAPPGAWSGIINTGTLNIKNNGALENISGDLLNEIDGKINISEGGNLLNKQLGRLTNKGEVNLFAATSGYLDSFPGALTNAGTLINEKGIIIQSAYAPDPVLPGLGDAGMGNSGTLENKSGATIKVYGYLGNSGVLNNAGELLNYNPTSGVISNEGALNNMIGAVLESYGRLNNYGTLRNDGNLTNRSELVSTGTITNKNVLDNYGVITNLGSSTGATLYNDGGTLNNHAGAILQNISGKFSVPPNYSNYLINNGTITNDGAIINNGIFVNMPDRVVNGSGVYSQYDPGARTINNGTMTQSCIEILAGHFGGSGTINVTCQKGLALAEGSFYGSGSSPGSMTINGNLTSAADMLFEIAGLMPGDKYDVLDINGTAEFLGGLITIAFIEGFEPELDNTFHFLRVSDGIEGWDNLEWLVTGLRPGFKWNIDYDDRGVFFDVTEVPGTGSVPEPGTYGLVLAALGLMGLMPRRRKALAS